MRSNSLGIICSFWPSDYAQQKIPDLNLITCYLVRLMVFCYAYWSDTILPLIHVIGFIHRTISQDPWRQEQTVLGQAKVPNGASLCSWLYHVIWRMKLRSSAQQPLIILKWNGEDVLQTVPGNEVFALLSPVSFSEFYDGVRSHHHLGITLLFSVLLPLSSLPQYIHYRQNHGIATQCFLNQSERSRLFGKVGKHV